MLQGGRNPSSPPFSLLNPSSSLPLRRTKYVELAFSASTSNTPQSIAYMSYLLCWRHAGITPPRVKGKVRQIHPVSTTNAEKSKGDNEVEAVAERGAKITRETPTLEKLDQRKCWNPSIPNANCKRFQSNQRDLGVYLWSIVIRATSPTSVPTHDNYTNVAMHLE